MEIGGLISGKTKVDILVTPIVTLMVLDLVPHRRGMAASLQTFVGSAANGLVAGLISPLVMHDTRLLALASLLLMSIGLVSWIVLQRPARAEQR